jgi:predicted regulator of Ras-like GTPase activity (Roadblock/LC7/MglB family)
MTALDDALNALRDHPGVEHLLLVGRDGLLIRELGEPGQIRGETLAAMLPELASACETVGQAAERGAFLTAVIEMERGVIVSAAVTRDVLLAAVVRAGVGFAPLLRTLRTERAQLAELL